MSKHSGSRKCFFCGDSILQKGRKSYLLTEDYLATHPNVLDYAQHRLNFQDQLNQMTAKDRICRACLQCANRFATTRRKTQERVDSIQQHPNPDGSMDFLPIQIPIVLDDPLRVVRIEYGNDSNDSLHEASQEQDIPEQNFQHFLQEQKSAEKPVIPVPGFKRIANSAKNCFIASCTYKQNLHRITLPVRQNILCKQSVYIPYGVRVCGDHLGDQEVWKDVVKYCRCHRDTFNGEQISDMLKLLQKKGKVADSKKK